MMNVSSIVRVRGAYVPTIVRPQRIATGVGFVDDTVDALEAAFGIDEPIGDLASTDALDEWSASIEVEDPGTDDQAVIEDAVKRKPSSTKTPPTSSGVAAAKSLQASLKVLGYDIGPTGVDGKIGPRTKGAIVKFKKDAGIKPADGTVTPALRKALDAAVKKKAAGPVAIASGSGGSGLLIAVVAAILAVGAYLVLRK